MSRTMYPIAGIAVACAVVLGGMAALILTNRHGISAAQVQPPRTPTAGGPAPLAATAAGPSAASAPPAAAGPSASAAPSASAGTSASAAPSASAPTGPAAQLDGHTYVITSATTGLAMDLWSSNGSDGAPVIAYPRHGRANQQWQVTADGAVVMLRNAATGKCATVTPYSGEYIVVQAPCTGGATQQWGVRQASGGYLLVSVATDGALGPTDQVASNAPVLGTATTGGQPWVFTPTNGQRV